MNVLKEPGTRKLCFLESIQAKRNSHLVDPSISYDGGAAKNPDQKKKSKLNQEVRERDQNFSPRP